MDPLCYVMMGLELLCLETDWARTPEPGRWLKAGFRNVFDFDSVLLHVKWTKLCQAIQWRSEDPVEDPFENSSNWFSGLLRCNYFLWSGV